MIFRVLVAAALGAPLSAGALAPNASAAPGSASFTCSMLKSAGTGASETFKFSGCGGNTGGHSKALPYSDFSSGAWYIHWSNGRYTELDAPEISAIPVHCPNGATGGAIQWAIIADTTGSASVGTLTSWETCPTRTGGFKLAPKTLADI
jgi:hypothetical protein